MGIFPERSNQTRNSINPRNLFMIIPLMYYLFFGLLFLIFKAKTITEAGISFYTVTTTLGCLTYFLINMFSNMPKIRNIIGKFENFIEKRKCLGYIWSQCNEIWFNLIWNHSGVNYSGTSTDYSKLNENIEQMSKIAHLIFMQLSFIGIASSALLITGINYYINDLKEMSFYLPFPVMYVFVYLSYSIHFDFYPNWIKMRHIIF